MLVTKYPPLKINQYIQDVGDRLALYNFQSVVSAFTPYRDIRVVAELNYEGLFRSTNTIFTTNTKNHVDSCDYQETLRVYDVNTQKIVMEYEEPDKQIYCSVDFSYLEQSILLSGSNDSKVKIWCTKQQTSAINIHANTYIRSVKYSPESSTYIKVGSVDHSIHYYDLRNTSRPLCIVSGQKETVSYEKLWSNDELASAATDNIVRLWNVKEHHPVSNFVGVSRDFEDIPTDQESKASVDSAGILDGRNSEDSDSRGNLDGFESEISLDSQGNLDLSNSEASSESRRNLDGHDEIHSCQSSPLIAVSELISSLDYENDTHDIQENPADKTKKGGWPAAACILGVELGQRLCVVGVSANVFVYMRGALQISSSESANILTTCIGCLNILAIFGGFLADVKFGRYKVIVGSAVISIVGLALVSGQTFTYTTLHGIPNLERWTLFLCLYTFAIGIAGIKSSALSFGFDQFDESDPQALKAKTSFFNVFYRCVDVSSLFAITVLYYLQEKFGNLAYSIGISTGMMIIAFVLLLCGHRSYCHKNPNGSPLTILFRVMLGAWKNKKKSYPEHSSLLNGQKKLRCLEKATIVHASRNKDRTYATMSQVEDVKQVIKLVPIWLTFIFFWTVYSQMNTFTIEQATAMNRKYGALKIPVIPFLGFLYFSALLFSSLYEHVFVRIEMTHGRKGFTSLQKSGIGLAFSVLGMVAAAICETRRRGMDGDLRAKMSAFWLVPQLCLLGAGEAFSYGQLEFFITEAPERMKSTGSILFFSTVGIGYFGSSFLVFATNIATHRNWLKTDLNQGRLDNFYWMLAVMGFFNLLAFFYVASRYHYRIKQEDRTSNINNV